jgi:putative tryptophan/tyrosine transport system substrate-binding protein
MSATMKRREFISLCGAVAAPVLLWPLTVWAQQGAQVRRIGILAGGVESDPILLSFVTAFREGLRRLGWIESGNVQIESRFAASDTGRARAYVAELAAMNPDVILSDNTPIVQELQRRTHTIPIVFVSLADPVDTGIVSSLARPGGNTTGFMNPEPAMSGKWLELLKEITPGLGRVLVLVNAGNVGNASRLRVIETVAPSLGVRVSSSAIRGPSDIEGAINAFVGESNVGLIAAPAAPINDLRKVIFGLAARHHLPAVYAYRYYAVDGGLMSYGVEPAAMWAQAATYVDRILRGEKPADLPVQTPIKFQLIINLKTAKTMGLTIPESLLLRADEVIE